MPIFEQKGVKSLYLVIDTDRKGAYFCTAKHRVDLTWQKRTNTVTHTTIIIRSN